METSARRGKQYYLTYLKWYTLLFFAVYFGVFLMFSIAGYSYIWTDDGLSQYLPKAYYFMSHTHQLIRNFLSGDLELPMYDFTIGLGHAAPLCLEPLYWLYLFFGASHAEAAFAIVMLLRFYLTGLSMSAFMLYFQNSRMASLLACAAYLGSDFCLWGCFQHSQFAILMLMLPLMLLSVEEICRKRRWYLCTLLVWIHLWCGYYFLYMNTIAMGVYFLIRFLERREGRTLKNFFLRARTIVCSYLLGVLIGNTALVATFGSYLNSSRTTAIDYGGNINYLFYGFSWVWDVFRGFLTGGRSPGYWLRLGFVPLIVVGIVLLLSRKGQRGLKAALTVGTLFCMIPAAAFVMSGFSSISNRWCYMYAFVMALILGFAGEQLLCLTRRQMLAASLALLPFLLEYGYELVTGAGSRRAITAVSAASILITILVLFYLHARPGISRKKRQGILTAGLLLSLWGVQLQTFLPGMGSLLTEFCQAGEALDRITSTPLAAAYAIGDDTFYRVASKRVNTELQGASQVLGYRGTVHYDNSASRDIQDFYRTLGLSSWSLVRMKGFDGRAMTDALASVKYYLLNKGEPENLPYGYRKLIEADADGQCIEIFENEYALPLGYTYDTVCSYDTLTQIETPFRQEALLQAAVLEEPQESGLAEASAGEIASTAYPAAVRDISPDKGITLKEKYIKVRAGGAKELRFNVDVPEGCELYLYVKKPVWNSRASATVTYRCGEYEQSYLLHGKRNTYRTGQEDLVINLGWHEAGETACTLTFPRSMTLHFADVQILCQPMTGLKTYTDHLKEAALEEVQLLPDCIKGSISLEQDRLLVLSVPYDRGWKAYVDGKETKLLKANLMYTGLALTAGEHEIELRYAMPGLRVSLLLSAAGLAVFLAALIVRRRRQHAVQHHHSML